MRRTCAMLVKVWFAALLAVPAAATAAGEPGARFESGRAAVTSPESRFGGEPRQGAVPRGVVPIVQPRGISPLLPRAPVGESRAPVPATPAERQLPVTPPELPVVPSRRQGAQPGIPPAPGTPPVPGGSLAPGTTPSGASNPATQPGTLPGGPVQ